MRRRQLFHQDIEPDKAFTRAKAQRPQSKILKYFLILALLLSEFCAKYFFPD